MNAFTHDVDAALPRRAGLIRRRRFLAGNLLAAGAALAQGGVLTAGAARRRITPPLPQVSADFPGVACSMIEREMPGAVRLFLQGAAGNVNPLCIGGVDEYLQRIGSRLGRSALKLVKQLR